MQKQEIKYGLRNRYTGALLRLQTSFGYSETYGEQTDYYLTNNTEHPYLMEDHAQALFNARYGKAYSCTPAYQFEDVPRDIEDHDVVRFVTTSDIDPGQTDPLEFNTQIEKLHFEFVENVGFEELSPQRLRHIFPDAKELAGGQMGIYFFKLTDDAPPPAEGSVLVSRKGTKNARLPMGVVHIRQVGSETFFMGSQMVHEPRFYSATPIKTHREAEFPWGDCKVAFDYDPQTDDWEIILKDVWDQDMQEGNVWPNGWSLNEIDSSGARRVLIFRIEGDLRRQDGEIVKSLIEKMEQGIDPRDDHEVNKTMSLR